MPKKARELPSNITHLPAYKAPDMRGRVSHSKLWERALKRSETSPRVWVEFPR